MDVIPTDGRKVKGLKVTRLRASLHDGRPRRLVEMDDRSGLLVDLLVLYEDSVRAEEAFHWLLDVFRSYVEDDDVSDKIPIDLERAPTLGGK